jgi:Ca2+-binding EF-hand superfamily protein
MYPPCHPQELEALRTAFSRVGPDERGEVRVSQLRDAFAHIGMEPSDGELDAVFEALCDEPVGEDTCFSFADFAQACDILSPVES